MGSPSNLYGVSAGRWVVEINDQKIKSLGDLFALIQTKEFKEEEFLRIRTVDLYGVSALVSIPNVRPESGRYFPTTYVRFDESENDFVHYYL